MATINVKDASDATVAIEKPLTPGRAAAASSRPVVLSTEDKTSLDALATLSGAVTETAPASDTASAGLNGRLQRIAQRLTSLIALLPSSLGIKTAAGSLSITHASDDALLAATGAIGDSAWASGNGTHTALLKAIATAANDTTTASPVLVKAWEYETVAASATDQALGATGATGDYISHVLIIPATTSPGAVSIKDGSGSAITIFTGGASSVSNLVPFVVPLGLKSTNGAWKVTTGTNVSAIGAGDFT